MLSGLYRIVPLDADRVELCNAGRSIVLRGSGFADKVTPLLHALDGTTEYDDLAVRFPDLVPKVLVALAGRRLLVDGDPDGGPAGPPALTAAALAEHCSPAEAAAALAGASVAVVGCGPVAATAAVHLAKAGAGRLLLVDGGVVSERDVVVSPLLPAAATGTPRAATVRDLCGATGGRAAEAVTTPLSGAQIEAAALLIIEGRYGPGPPVPPEADVALAAGTRYIVHEQDALEAVIGPSVGRGGEPCHHCADSRRLAHVQDLDELLAYRRQRSTEAPMPDAFLAAHTSFLAGLLATEALRALLGAPHRTDHGALVIDLAAMEVEREEILPVPGCSGCASAPAIVPNEVEV